MLYCGRFTRLDQLMKELIDKLKSILMLMRRRKTFSDVHTQNEAYCVFSVGSS